MQSPLPTAAANSAGTTRRSTSASRTPRRGGSAGSGEGDGVRTPVPADRPAVSTPPRPSPAANAGSAAAARKSAAWRDAAGSGSSCGSAVLKSKGDASSSCGLGPTPPAGGGQLLGTPVVRSRCERLTSRRGGAPLLELSEENEEEEELRESTTRPSQLTSAAAVPAPTLLTKRLQIPMSRSVGGPRAVAGEDDDLEDAFDDNHAAMENFARFHGRPRESVNLRTVMESAAGVPGWAAFAASPDVASPAGSQTSESTLAAAVGEREMQTDDAGLVENEEHSVSSPARLASAPVEDIPTSPDLASRLKRCRLR
eukprot:TRINITY_DN37110_c0_g1_i1.p1 TRINITY_DN37110_c0_g1~~TRINITY_DN37110_c0_g1_i1.p1  ORF type:complete len:312 (-),score=75.48 TRINITY_DN37110_c0_g1_i1:60-995(-)